MKNVVRVWIGDPYDGGHFNGTAFFIDEHRLVTAKHVVVKDHKVHEQIFISNTPDGGVTPISNVILCERDMAVLEVKKSFLVEKLKFTKTMHVGDDINVIGFYDKNSSRKHYENNVSGYLSHEHTYELQNHLTHGLSGSPVLLNGKVCGVTKAINSSKNITYVIPISELCIDISVDKQVKQTVPFSTTEPKKPSSGQIFFTSFSNFAKYVGFFVIAIILLALWVEDDTEGVITSEETQQLTTKSVDDYITIANSYYDQYQYSKAFKYLELALEKDKNKVEKDIITAQLYASLGRTSYNMKNMDRALTYSTKALELYKNLLQENDLTVAAIYYDIAQEYNAKGDYSNAYIYIQEVYKIYMRLVPPNDPRFIQLNQDIYSLKITLGI